MGIVEAEGEASVAVAEEDHVGHGAGNEQVGAHVKLPPLQQQRVLDVPGGHRRAEPMTSLARVPLPPQGQFPSIPATCPRCDLWVPSPDRVECLLLARLFGA